MGERTNNIITKEFTFNVTDEYLSQSNTEGKTGTLTYSGPDKWWVFAEADTGIVHLSPEYTEAMDGDLIPTPEGMVKVFIDANTETMMAYLVQGIVDPDMEYVEEVLPNGQVYREPATLLPHMVYDCDQIVYNADTGEFTMPWLEPHVTMDDIRTARNAWLDQTDTVLINKVLTDEQRTELENFRQELRDLTDQFSEYPAWKVAFPDAPAIGGLE